MQEVKRHCLQCEQEKPLDEFFVYAKTGKHYSWCKECVRKSAEASKANHASRAQKFRERWGSHAI